MGKKPSSEPDLKQAYARIAAQRAEARRDACPTPEELLAIVEKRIGRARRLELLDHVTACSECLREFRLLQTLAEGRRALG